jgi:hypothetical protein
MIRKPEARFQSNTICFVGRYFVPCTSVPLTRHSGMYLAGLNLPGADLNSQKLARRAEYMDVLCNPVTYGEYANQ